MDDREVSRVVKKLMFDLPNPSPYCIYVHGGNGIREDVVSLVGSRTGSLVVEVEPRCDYYDVNLDSLLG